MGVKAGAYSIKGLLYPKKVLAAHPMLPEQPKLRYTHYEGLLPFPSSVQRIFTFIKTNPTMEAHSRGNKQVSKRLIDTVDDKKKPCITLRTLNYGNYGTLLIMGNAGFISSTVVSGLSRQVQGP